MHVKLLRLIGAYRGAKYAIYKLRLLRRLNLYYVVKDEVERVVDLVLVVLVILSQLRIS